jgi:muconolactone delta-isomerase
LSSWSSSRSTFRTGRGRARSRLARGPRHPPRRGLADEGHLVRLWNTRTAHAETKALGLYRADSEAQLAGLLGALPLYDWMHVTCTPLEPDANDPMSPAIVSAAAAS